jgi:hypothetical protein
MNVKITWENDGNFRHELFQADHLLDLKNNIHLRLEKKMMYVSVCVRERQRRGGGKLDSNRIPLGVASFERDEMLSCLPISLFPYNSLYLSISLFLSLSFKISPYYLVGEDVESGESLIDFHIVLSKLLFLTNEMK